MTRPLPFPARPDNQAQELQPDAGIFTPLAVPRAEERPECRRALARTRARVPPRESLRPREVSHLVTRRIQSVRLSASASHASHFPGRPLSLSFIPPPPRSWVARRASASQNPNPSDAQRGLSRLALSARACDLPSPLATEFRALQHDRKEKDHQHDDDDGLLLVARQDQVRGRRIPRQQRRRSKVRREQDERPRRVRWS